MQKKQLNQLFPNAQHKDMEISSIDYDSRNVQKNGVFFALKGTHVDGHNYIEQALDAGALAIVHSDPIASHRPGVSYIKVPDTRIALSSASAAFWNHPSKAMSVIGVTGTDGKSTTVALIRQLLEIAGESAGSISTVNFSIAGKTDSNRFRLSTPEAPQLHQMLRAMLDASQDYAVVEATSHGLSSRTSRLADVHFDAAVFTNISSEHLDFHGDMESYRDDKARLFQMIAESKNPDAFGVVNADDPFGDFFIDATGEKAFFTYSLHEPEADLYATNLLPDPAGTDFTLVTPVGKASSRINLPGIYNVENVLAALCTAAEFVGEEPLELASEIQNLSGIKGRMEHISAAGNFDVIVDYAHSPGSFSKVLPFVKSLTQSRLIIVFGSAGERDREKRPMQGQIAAEYADIVLLTDEDPRGENSMDILRDIAAGASSLEEGEDLFLIPERREAIHQAFKMAADGDIVLLLGKGHEQSIIYADGPKEWDEAQVCRDLLKEL